ncbi:hypothetical protein HK097_011028 [Rhizophlyctis rosea]|uniref:Uncharacterized protein n=1 Tax=Rhizophlyctis rosea TaxID=64517 RepID=A0AAD5X3C8_9FUNG|nr:hypothetical protein HK097_011028 [Rhizophlyctis rosea]
MKTRSRSTQTEPPMETLRNILQNRWPLNEVNRYAPTEEQCKELDRLNGRVAGERVMPTEAEGWRDCVAEHLEDQLFFQVRNENGGLQRKKDAFVRARVLVDFLEEGNFKRVTFLDGHGRFTFALLTILLENRTMRRRLRRKKLQLVVIDKNIVVHRWHRQFFPTDAVLCKEGDIYRSKVEDGDFLYFNFCRIGGEEGQKKFASFVRKHQAALPQILLSMSNRGIEYNAHYIPTTIQNQLRNYEITRKTDGKMFITLNLTRQTEAPAPGGEPDPDPQAQEEHESLPDFQTLKSMNMINIRKFAKNKNLKVKLNVGGRSGRTKLEIINDVWQALKQHI